MAQIDGMWIATGAAAAWIALVWTMAAWRFRRKRRAQAQRSLEEQRAAVEAYKRQELEADQREGRR